MPPLTRRGVEGGKGGGEVKDGGIWEIDNYRRRGNNEHKTVFLNPMNEK